MELMNSNGTPAGTIGASTLLVASPGAPLMELLRLSERLTPSSGRVTWVTHDDSQTRSMLAGRRVHMVPYMKPSRRVTANLGVARDILRRGYYERVVTTGAGVALPFVTAARMAGIPCHYIESAGRADGPGPIARRLRHVPGVHYYTQCPSWADDRWSYRGSLLDSYETQRLYKFAAARVVVALGNSPHPFRRAVNRLRGVLPQVVAPGAQILWQLGPTASDGATGRITSSMGRSELRKAISEAELVITDADFDAALTAMDLGRRPVLLPRRARFGEAGDDHQVQVAQELGRRGLALWAEAHELTPDQLRRAQASRIALRSVVAPFELAPAPRKRSVRWLSLSDPLPAPGSPAK